MEMASRNLKMFESGTLVEVSSDEVGFSGAWFMAKVLDPPPPPPPPSPTKTLPLKKMKYLVEYQNLLSHDNSKLLRELVDFKLVRPLPPPPPSDDEQQTFQQGDVVDAYYNDGWWVGVVDEVWEKPRSYSVLFENPLHTLEFGPSDLRLHLDWDGQKWVQPQKQNKISEGGGNREKQKTSSRKRKRGKHAKLSLKGKQYDRAEDVVAKIFGEDSSTGGAESAIIEASAENVAELSKSGSKAKDTEIAIIPSNMVGADEHMSISIPTVVDSRACMVDNTPYESQSLRYLESSPVLRFVQSLEEFQLMPQKPHFHPLDECEEVCREGLVLKLMMTFVNVVKKTSKLQANAPQSIMDSLLKCLSELDLHGFDVKPVRSCLLELQAIKASQEKLRRKSEKVKYQIMEWTPEETKIKAELDDAVKDTKVLEEKIKVLEEKRKVAEEKTTGLKSMYEEIHSRITNLKSSSDLLDEDIQTVQHNFARVAGSLYR